MYINGNTIVYNILSKIASSDIRLHPVQWNNKKVSKLSERQFIQNTQKKRKKKLQNRVLLETKAKSME